jgi:hypothetical protein
LNVTTVSIPRKGRRLADDGRRLWNSGRRNVEAAVGVSRSKNGLIGQVNNGRGVATPRKLLLTP